ncbi:MAG: transposase [bacterium]
MTFVLMNNHFHLVVEMEEPKKLSVAMAGMLRSYVYYHHKRYNSAGHLWQGRFKSQAIEKEPYLLACGRYVERNPVLAGLVDYAWKWPHSSAKFYCLGIEDGLTVSDPIWDKGTDDRGHKQYQEWLSEEVEGEAELFRNADQALGREGFLARLVRVGDRDMPRHQGRPRKREGIF